MRSDNIFDKTAELNLGRSEQLEPGADIGDAGPEVKLSLIGEVESKTSQVVTFHFSSFTPVLTLNPGGPCVGIVEFGAGGAKLNRVEFDIPTTRPFVPDFRVNIPRRELNNGVSVSVVGSGFQSLARNDGMLNPVNDPTVAIGGGNNIVVSTHVGRFPLGRSNNLKRTVHVVSDAGVNLAAGANVSFGIPNYAKFVVFPRNPMSGPIEVLITGITATENRYLIPANGLNAAPDRFPIPISPDAFTMTIFNTGLAGMISLLAVFELDV